MSEQLLKESPKPKGWDCLPRIAVAVAAVALLTIGLVIL